ncbi:Protein ANTAGONIST OF LIKE HETEROCHROMATIN PROTEIN 1 [Frankliniella fusca]|uniref:Protein ANTAGONIST OF LIKE HETEROCHROMATIN PROTEIN 1 n=1 Tax=Frankliniella fusca TaxID=407009 RepID=A0AAE1I2S7_9NEOP|nr:Protein ANTAGONIST OF LIKE HETEROCHROMATIN PROTEIN 1 [Frankliniella fusca]
MQAVVGVLLFNNAAQNDNDVEDGERCEEVINVDIDGFRAMSNTSFREHFRMDTVSFSREKSTHKATHATFGKKEGSIHFQYRWVIEALAAMSRRFIKWPDALEKEEIKVNFEERHGYPGIVGAIDGVLFPIQRPREQPERLQDRHHRYLMLAHAVGGIGDVRNYGRSPLSINVLTMPHLLSAEEHILAAGAYTLTSKIITPYHDRQLTVRQRTHNILLSATRTRIENSFVLLKGKERRLKYLHMTNHTLVCEHIIASIVLHNYIILEGEDCPGLEPVNPAQGNDGDFERITNEARTQGPLKRENIAHVLHPDD